MNTQQIEVMKRAAANRYIWGRNSAKKYALNRGVPLWAYRMACQLQSVEG